MTNTARMLVALGAMLASAIAACGGDSTAPTGGGTGASTGTGGTGGKPAGQCSDAPLACPAGQTCWFNDMEGSDFQCLESGPGKVGDMCDNFVGMPTCGDGMICLQLEGDPSGSCSPYCDVDHVCPMNVKCTGVMTPGGVLLHACVPQGTGGMDAGTDGGGMDAGADGG